MDRENDGKGVKNESDFDEVESVILNFVHGCDRNNQNIRERIDGIKGLSRRSFHKRGFLLFCLFILILALIANIISRVDKDLF